MIKYVMAFFMLTYSASSFSDENSAIIQVDLKILCQIKKMKKRLSEDKKISTADLAERLSEIKTVAVKAQATKDAITAISMSDKKEHSKLWLQFAKNHKVNVDCL